jgi:hypothetical protein
MVTVSPVFAKNSVPDVEPSEKVTTISAPAFAENKNSPVSNTIN